MTQPLVSVIMPTANRPHFLERAINNFLKQDYENKELVIVYDFPDANTYYPITELIESHNYLNIKLKSAGSDSLCSKRNFGVANSTGSVIMHADDDDFYASDWITKSVNHLLTTGVELTGLHSAYFCEPPNKALLYKFDNSLPPNKPYVIGATMCYLKSFWEKHPFYFRDGRTSGEDWNFSMDCNNLIPHNYTDGFVAMLHGANTASHKNLTAKEFQPVSMDKIRSIMGSEFERFTTL